jgi:AAA family ATP:ADP antiporter
LAVVAQLKRLSNLEPGDLSKVGPIAGAYTLTLATIYVLKPARNALFLERVGVDQLPWVLMLVAVVGGLFVAVYGRLAAWIRTDRLVPTTFVVLAGSLLVFRPLLELQAHWVYFVFFVWVQVFGLVATSLVWLWASSAFDPRRARRVFGIIGSGGIAGAIVGGVFTGAFAGALGTPNLLFVASGLVVLALAALRFAPRARDGRGDEPDVGAKALRRGGDGVTRRLPRLLAINAAVIAFAAVFVDIQFNHVVDRHYDSAEAKAAFFGAFFAWVSGFSLVFQVAITPWLLRRHGVGPALAVLPGALGLGSVAMLLGPVFPVATLPKAADGSFRHSVHKAASELLFLPIPERVKRRTKLFIDTTVDTAATGLGALAVVGLVQGVGLSYAQLTFFTVGLIALSLLLVRRLRRAYVDAFRQAIERRHIDLSRLTVGLDEAGVLDLLLPALRSEHPRQVLYALDLLSSARASGVREAVAPLLEHHDPRIRTRAVEVLGPDPVTFDDRNRPRVLEDEDPEVRAAALRVWLGADAEAAEPVLAEWLDGDDPARIGPALEALHALPPDRRRRYLSEARLDRLETLRTDEPAIAAPLAGALASAAEPRLYPRLERALEHAPQPVSEAAIGGFAESADPAYVPWLLDRLADRRSRAAARRALAAFGDEVAGPLAGRIDDPNVALTARRAAIRTLSDLATPSATGVLLARLQHPEPALAREVVDALARIRRRHPRVRFSRAPVREAIDARIAEWRLILASLGRLPSPDVDATRLFHRAMREKADRLRDEIMALLSLRHDATSMADAAQRIASGDPATRARAIEFVENTLDSELSRRLVPLLESSDPELALSRTDPALGALPEDPESLLEAWARSRDPWLSACALYAARHIAPALDPAPWSNDGAPHPLVEEILSGRPLGPAGDSDDSTRRPRTPG